MRSTSYWNLKEAMLYYGNMTERTTDRGIRLKPLLSKVVGYGLPIALGLAATRVGINSYEKHQAYVASLPTSTSSVTPTATMTGTVEPTFTPEPTATATLNHVERLGHSFVEFDTQLLVMIRSGAGMSRIEVNAERGYRETSPSSIGNFDLQRIVNNGGVMGLTIADDMYAVSDVTFVLRRKELDWPVDSKTRMYSATYEDDTYSARKPISRLDADTSSIIVDHQIARGMIVVQRGEGGEITEVTYLSDFIAHDRRYPSGEDAGQNSISYSGAHRINADGCIDVDQSGTFDLLNQEAGDSKDILGILLFTFDDDPDPLRSGD